MARIHIEPAKAKRSVLDDQSLEKKLSNLSQEVSSIRSNMRYKISGREQISDRLRQVAQQISKEATSTRALSNGLQQVITKYEQTENAARDRAKADKTSVQAAANGTSDSLLSKLWDWVKSPEYQKAVMVSAVLNLISPVCSLLYLTSGIAVGKTPSITDPTRTASSTSGGDWFGYEFDEDHPGVTAWIGKAYASAENEWGKAGVNGYIGKASAEAKADFSFMESGVKKKYVDGKWTEKETTEFINAEIGAGAGVSALAFDANAGVGSDMLGTNVKAEGGIGNAKVEAKGKFSVGDDGVNANVSGKAMVSAAEGKASLSVNILGLEIKGKVGGYAGAIGVEGKAGIENGKFVAEGGAAALLGLSAGVEVGFNDEGWSNFLDFITFWD